MNISDGLRKSTIGLYIENFLDLETTAAKISKIERDQKGKGYCYLKIIN